MTDIIKDPALDFNGFYDQMRQALQKAQDLGKSGWDICPTENLYSGLRKALIEGHFVDAANYCLFLQRRSDVGFNFAELDELVDRHAISQVQKDTIRLANVTIEQHEATIRALREGDKYTGEDIAQIIEDSHNRGLADGAARARIEVTEELRKAGIKHGTYQDSNGMEVWHYGKRRVVMGSLDKMDVPKESSRTAEEIDRMNAEEQEHASELRRAVNRGQLKAAAEGRPYLYSSDPMWGRRNDELLNEAFIGSGKLQSAEIVGEVAQFTANTTGYITVTRVGNEVTTTAEIEGPSEDVRQTLVDIAYALGNGPTPMEIKNSDVSTSCDPAFGVDVGEVLANSQARGR